MDKLNLNELLRYGFAGALFLISLVSSFKEAQEIISKLPSDFFGATTVLGVVLVGGRDIIKSCGWGKKRANPSVK